MLTLRAVQFNYFSAVGFEYNRFTLVYSIYIQHKDGANVCAMRYLDQKRSHDFFQTLAGVHLNPESLAGESVDSETTARYCSVDRGRFLHDVFEEIAGGITGRLDQAFAVEQFCRRYFTHCIKGRVNTDGQWILDPVLNYHARFLKCGEISRLLLDILHAGGIDGRLVILSAHQGAEAMVDGRWVFLEADLFDFAQRPVTERGEPASVADIYNDPRIADRLIANSEMQLVWQATNKPFGGTFYPGFVFREMDQPLEGRPRIPSILRRKAPPEKWPTMPGFGWFGPKPEEHEVLARGVLPVWPRHRRSPAPRWRSIQANGGTLDLSWKIPSGPPVDGVVFRVDLASESRGWCYHDWGCSEELRSWWSFSSRERTTVYESIDFFPNADLGSFRVTDPHLTIDLTKYQNDTIFISITAEDAYGQEIGNMRYIPSEEIAVRRSDDNAHG